MSKLFYYPITIGDQISICPPNTQTHNTHTLPSLSHQADVLPLGPSLVLYTVGPTLIQECPTFHNTQK